MFPPPHSLFLCYDYIKIKTLPTSKTCGSFSHAHQQRFRCVVCSCEWARNKFKIHNSRHNLSIYRYTYTHVVRRTPCCCGVAWNYSHHTHRTHTEKILASIKYGACRRKKTSYAFSSEKYQIIIRPNQSVVLIILGKLSALVGSPQFPVHAHGTHTTK